MLELVALLIDEYGMMRPLPTCVGHVIRYNEFQQGISSCHAVNSTDLLYLGMSTLQLDHRNRD